MRKPLLVLFVLAALSSQAQNTADSGLNAHFIIFSDPHYYDPSLGTEGEAFEKYLDNDRKLLRESRELLMEAMALVNNSEATFVVVPGDLTKDGTRVSHEMFAGFMLELESKGRQVYVVPGNHDILNGESYAYEGDRKIKMENVSPGLYQEIYRDLGYDRAFYKDPNTLSYVTEPVEGLWLFGLDACRYRENDPDDHAVTDGKFSKETLEWIRETALKGEAEGKRMIAFMHHGVNEHYEKQDRFFGEYVVDDYKKVSSLFASLGINVVFTGHFHAQDITLRTWKNGNYLLDVETGSLVTFPCPVREVEIAGNIMTIRSHYIRQIPSNRENFEEYSREYVKSGVAGIAENVMMNMGLKEEEAGKLSGQIGDAFVAHYSGDEPAVSRYLDVTGVGLLGRIMILTKRRLIKELHSDLYPSDNEVVIDLETGITGVISE